MIWRVVIPGKPVPKARPRVTRFGTYTPARTVEYQRVCAAAINAVVRQMIASPVRCDLLIVLPRPLKYRRSRDPDGLMWAPVRPDVDNVRKAIMDSMSGVLVDDAIVVAGMTRKVYAEKDGSPRVELTLETLTPGEAHL